MRSPQVERYEPDSKEKEGYTDLQVLRSPAGYYVGTMYVAEDGFTEPGSRDSGYFKTRKEEL